MTWKLDGRELLSECGDYKINNFGSRGGDQYCLWFKVKKAVIQEYTQNRRKRSEPKDVFCQLVSMGTLEECKEKYQDLP